MTTTMRNPTKSFGHMATLFLLGLLALMSGSGCDARRSYMRHSVMILSSVSPSKAYGDMLLALRGRYASGVSAFAIDVCFSLLYGCRAIHARQLVHDNDWGTLATISVPFKGVPFANIVSYSGEQEHADFYAHALYELTPIALFLGIVAL